ncbi:hypothetical protein [Enterobacter asburiae]
MLENLSGVTLFQRSRHGAKLTIAGEQLLHEAYEAVNYYEKLLRKAGIYKKVIPAKLCWDLAFHLFA